jgi:hypothetical protein
MKLLVNVVAFQVGWFATVLGAANGIPWLGPLAALAVAGLHLRASQRPAVEARLLVAAMGLGVVADSALLATGWIAYPNGEWLPGLAPFWIVTMWALFATTLNVSMRWLRGRTLLAALFGAVGGPLSYLAGARLGAMTFIDTTAALVALAAGWGVLMPALMALAARLDGTRPGTRPAYVRDSWQRVDSHG